MILMLLTPSDAWGGRWKDAFKRSIKDPHTWIPAAGAAALVASGSDDAIADWAVRETPLFGSPERARKSSDSLRTAVHAAMGITGLFAHREQSYSRRLGSTLIQFAAASTANNSASVFKRITRRTRPDGSDDLSLPSNHSTAAFAYAGIGNLNLDAVDLPSPLRRTLKIGLVTVAAGSSWGRVEGGVHYPSDVLIGAALGNLVATFINEAFLPSNRDVRMSLDLAPDEVRVGMSWHF